MKSPKVCILIGTHADIDSSRIGDAWKGFGHYTLGEVGEDSIRRLEALTGRLSLELPRRLRERRPGIFDEYLELIRRINKRISHPLWQACDVAAKGTSRNGFLWISTTLVNHIDLVLEETTGSPGLILAGLSRAAIQCLRVELEKRGVTARVVRGRFGLRDFKFFKWLRFFKNSFVFMRAWNFRLRAVRRVVPSPTIRAESAALVIRSYGFAGSFVDHSYRDPFFQPLAERLITRKIRFQWLIYLQAHDPKTLSAASSLRSDESLKFYEEYLNNFHLWRIALTAPFVWFAARSALRDISPILFEEAFELFSQGGFFHPILHYFAGRLVTENNPTARILYPFENLSWERLFLRGIKEANPTAPTIGFQHSLLVPLFLPTRLARGEWRDVQLPEKIFTTGDLALECMAEKGHYPRELMKTGCMLRQRSGPAYNPARAPKTSGINVLVTLNTVPDAVGILRFLQRSCIGPGAVAKITLRFHPLFGPEMIRPLVTMPENDFVHIDAETSIEKSAAQSDVVLYCGSTAAVECLLLRGTPLIYLAINDIAEYDVLESMTTLKRSVEEPTALAQIILELASLSTDQYAAESKGAKTYLDGYFKPANTRILDEFIENILATSG